MASTGKCPYCGSVVRSDQPTCPACGAPNECYVAESARSVTQPRTIEELQAYCAQHNMPLLRMRFFLGEDCKEPRAFGIYRDGANVVVYKNKSDGTRAVRYRGPDEARAVNELFLKLLDECHRRGIYPDGRPAQESVQRGGRSSSGGSGRTPLMQKPFFPLLLFLAVVVIILIGRSIAHSRDGYYSFGGDDVYYHYGSSWYSSYGDDWYEIDEAPVESYQDYQIGDEWDSDWGVSDFHDSSAWDEIQSSSDSSDDDYDYDSWDSSDTDWDSDW